MSELRGLITAGTFISVTILLISFIPIELFTSTTEIRTIDPPVYFEAIDLSNYVSTWNSSLDLGEGIIYYQQALDDGGGDFAGHRIELWSEKTLEQIMFKYLRFWWIFVVGYDSMQWFNEAGILVSDEYGITNEVLDDTYDDYGKMRFLISGDTQFHAYFSFNDTTYETPTEAWLNDELYVYCGINFDQAGTGYNAWDVIQQVLFFQMPDIHPLINSLLAIPLWVCMAYLSYILILRAIGAVFGGGA